MKKSTTYAQRKALPIPESQDFHRVVHALVDLNYAPSDVFNRIPEFSHSLLQMLEGEVPYHCQWLQAEIEDHIFRAVAQRDNGVCQLCRLNTLHLQHALGWYQNHWRPGQASPQEFKFSLGHLATRWPRRLWDIDHIIPRAKGGPLYAIQNLRTLCLECHWKETQRVFFSGKSMDGARMRPSFEKVLDQRHKLQAWLKKKA